ncbi:MAG: BatD family protein [Muribaculaceae bacterium]|nr:BatD family protein [Muribaculaceae bacterium]
MNRTINIIALILLSTIVEATAATFRVQAPSQVEEGRTFRVEFILDGSTNYSDLDLPRLDGAQLLNGPEILKSMSSTTTIIINGQKITSSDDSQVIFSMLYQAVTPGTHTMKEASIYANGKRLTTRPISIEIVPNGSLGSSPSSPASPAIPDPSTMVPSQQSSSQQVDPNIKSSDLFIKVNLDKEIIYEQEAVVCTIKLYTRYPRVSCHSTQQPSFNGFLIEEIPVNPNNQSQEEINGRQYGTSVLKKCILYPQESGNLTITSGSYDVQVYQDIFDTPFGMFGPSVPVDLKVKSDPVSVKVRPLPEPKPANFSGAVGTFNVTTRINPSSFKTYAPATYSIIVTGSGNLKYIQNPKVDMPKQFDIYDPQNTINSSPSADNMGGSVTFDYLFIPQYVGDFKIPDSYFVYFNTETQQYDSIRIEGRDIKVAKGEGKPSEHYKLRNMDIANLHTGDTRLTRKQSFFITSPFYWIAMVLAVLAMIAALMMYRKRQKTHANTSLMRTRRASKLAQQRLKTANALMLKNDRDGFYNETLNALWGYLSDKLSIPVSELSKDNIATVMDDFGFSPNHIADTMHMLETCEFAQYAPDLNAGNMKQVYNDSATLIDSLERVKRKKDSNSTMRALTVITATLMALSTFASGIDYVQQGNKAYGSKDYQKAVELYERAAKDGTSSTLYYNLGNAYYRINDRGHAILNYERALKMDPSNSDARYNLEFVREKAQLVDDNGADFFSSLLGSWVSRVSSNAWAIIAFMSLLLTLAAIATYLIVDSVKLQKLGFFGAIAMAVIMLFALSCSIYMHSRCTSNNYAIILEDKAPVNKSPRAGDKDVAFTLPSGSKVEIVDSVLMKGGKSEWYKIETTGGKVGWMYKHNKDKEII